MSRLFELRDVKHKWWGIDELDHGDLASMAYLYDVKRFAHADWIEPADAVYNGPKRISLCVYGDSYTRYIKDTLQFAGLRRYRFLHRDRNGVCDIDTGGNNVLIIEISERYVRDFLGDTRMLNDLRVRRPKNDSLLSVHYAGAVEMKASLLPAPISVDSLFNKYINQNLQFNLFNYQFMMPLFTTKAALNFHLFDRASGDVVISDDKRFLFLRETAGAQGDASSYSSLSADEVTRLVNNLNVIYAHYRMEGFAEVYLSIIPNSATINQPKGYNGLIPAIQTDARLKMKVLDVYTLFRNAKEEVYLPGDTHWNTRGIKTWLDLVNDTLIARSR